MTPEEKRIKIAEACGWTKVHFDLVEGTIVGSRVGHRIGDPIIACTFPVAYTGEEVPDYLNDLNAMHEAEKTLKADKITGIGGWSDYAANLETICYQACVPKLHATATQRADAFLLTLGHAL